MYNTKKLSLLLDYKFNLQEVFNNKTQNNN